MNRPRRKSSLSFGAVGIAAVFRVAIFLVAMALPFAPAAQEIDNRPIYYVMVKSLEDAFQAHNAALAEDLKARELLLTNRHEVVNERIAARDGRINEERRIQKQHAPRFANDPRIKALKEGVVTRLTELEAIRKSYLESLAATRKARARERWASAAVRTLPIVAERMPM